MIDLASEHKRTILGILKTISPSTPVWVFGSRITKNAKPFSDVDLVLKGAHAMPDPIMTRLRDAFDESNLPYQVDLIDWHNINPEFRLLIEKKFELLTP